MIGTFLIILVCTSLVLDQPLVEIFGEDSCPILLHLAIAGNLCIIIGGFGMALYRLLLLQFPIQTRYNISLICYMFFMYSAGTRWALIHS